MVPFRGRAVLCAACPVKVVKGRSIKLYLRVGGQYRIQALCKGIRVCDRVEKNNMILPLVKVGREAPESANFGNGLRSDLLSGGTDDFNKYRFLRGGGLADRGH